MQSCTSAFSHFHDILNISQYNSSAPLQQFLTFSFTSKREREAVKNKKTHYGAIDKSQLEQQIRGSMNISCIVTKNWSYPPTTSGSYGRQACRQNAGDIKFLKFLTGQIAWILLHLISVQCYYSVSKKFQSAFLK